MDVVPEGLSADAAEESLNRLIERRAEEADEASRVHAAWAESVRAFDLRAQAERRREWTRYHLGLQRLHSQLAKEHREKALALLDEASLARSRGA